jgi:prevent-host-death family protein
MTIHVNIGEAKTRLSELIAASERGEEVVIARAGKPAVRLQPVEPVQDVVEMRRRAFGMWRDRISEEQVNALLEPMSEEDLALWYDAPIFPEGDDADAAAR